MNILQINSSARAGNSYSTRLAGAVVEQLRAHQPAAAVTVRDLGRTRGNWDLRAATSLLLGALFADAINRDFFPDHLPEPIADAPRRYVELFLAAIGYHDSRAE